MIENIKLSNVYMIMLYHCQFVDRNIKKQAVQPRINYFEIPGMCNKKYMKPG